MSPVFEIKKEGTRHVREIKKSENFTPFKPNEDSLIRTRQIIMNNHENDIKYDENCSNPTVHTILSLCQMGAPSTLLDEYYDETKSKLKHLPKEKYNIAMDNYENYIGDKSAYSSYVKFFDEQVKVLGLTQTIRKFFPKVIPGLAGEALHALIHLGYSVEFENPIVASEGLAYAYSHYFKLGKIIDSISPQKEIESIENFKSSKSDNSHSKAHTKTAYLAYELKKATAKSYDGEKGLLADRMSRVIEDNTSQLIELASKWGATEENIEALNEDLAIGTAEIFSKSHSQGTLDFFLLHTLTGNHALRQLLPHLKPNQQIELLNVNFVALAILFLTQGISNSTTTSTKLNSELGTSNSSETWGEIFTKAGESLNPHVITGVRILHQLQDKYGPMNDLFLTTASSLIMNISKNSWNSSGTDNLSKQ